MPSNIKLTYFDMKGVAEPIRLLLSLAGVEFQDDRIKHENWPEMKPKTPWGVLPILEVDGKQLCETLAILRFIGREYGLGGKDEFQTAKCDEYVDAMNDFRLECANQYFEEDETRKAELKKKIKEESLPQKWGKFNEILKQNGTGFLVGDKATYADVFVAAWVEYITMDGSYTIVMNAFPVFKEHVERVLALPGIKEWIAKRPASLF